MSYTFPEGTSKTNLDILFFANWGNRNPSPIVETCQTTYGQALTNNDLNLLKDKIYRKRMALAIALGINDFINNDF